MRRYIFVFVLVFLMCLPSLAFSGDTKWSLLLSGNTHSRIYVENGQLCLLCRRASLIDEMKKKKPVILLEIGDVLGGGVNDVKAAGGSRDKERSKAYLTQLKAMGYDAVVLTQAVSPKQKKQLYRMFQPIYMFGKTGEKSFYINRDGLKIGVLLLDNALADDVAKYNSLIAKMQGIDLLMVVFSEDIPADAGEKLLKAHKEIDILVVPSMEYMPQAGVHIARVGKQYILCPPEDGLSVIDVEIEKKNDGIKVADAKEISVLDYPEKEIKGIPACFSDKDCVEGVCESGRCVKKKTEEKPILLTVIRPKNCVSCNEDSVFSWLKGIFPNLEMKKLFVEQKEAKDYLNLIKTDMLPVYILPKEIDKTDYFENIEDMVIGADFGYVLKPQVTGMSVFYTRPQKKHCLDVFITGVLDKNTYGLLKAIKKIKKDPRTKDWKIYLRYLIKNEKGVWSSLAGPADMQEILGQLCVKKYAPNKYIDYLLCRYETGYKGDGTCVIRLGLDKEKISSCVTNQIEVMYALPENARLVTRTGANVPGLVLFENQQIFKPSPTVLTPENLIKWSQGKESGNE